MADYGHYHSAAAVTKHDTNNITGAPCSALYVGEVGDVAAVFQNGQVVVFKGVPAGTILPFSLKRVNSTDTSAASMVALW